MQKLTFDELKKVYEIVDTALAHRNTATLHQLDSLSLAHRVVGYQFAAYWHKDADKFQKDAIDGFVRAVEDLNPLSARHYCYRQTLKLLRNIEPAPKRLQEFKAICVLMLKGMTPTTLPEKPRTKRSTDHPFRWEAEKISESLRLVA